MCPTLKNSDLAKVFSDKKKRVSCSLTILFLYSNMNLFFTLFLLNWRILYLIILNFDLTVSVRSTLILSNINIFRFAVNPSQMTLIPLNPSVNTVAIGSRASLSPNDILSLNKAYSCAASMATNGGGNFRVWIRISQILRALLILIYIVALLGQQTF